MSFIGVTYMNIGEGLLIGAENSYLTKAYLSTAENAHNLGNLDHTVQLAGSSTGWRVSFPRDSV